MFCLYNIKLVFLVDPMGRPESRRVDSTQKKVDLKSRPQKRPSQNVYPKKGPPKMSTLNKGVPKMWT